MPSDASAPRKNVGYAVIGCGVALSAIVSIDRVALALSRSRIAADLQLTDAQMGLVFSAYATAYAICEVPSGFLGDRFGPLPVLMRIALWWSVFMAATAAVFNFISLYLSQFLFGAGEAGCYPNVTRVFSRWLPHAERVKAQGFIWLSARLAGAFTPILMAVLFRYMNWRQAFAAFSVLGVLWVISLHSWLRKKDDSLPVATVRPASHKPSRLLARSKTVWLLCAQYLALIFPWFFLITWAPTFIDERFHVSPAQSTGLKVLPLLFGGLGALTSGFISAPVTRWTGSIRAARRMIGFLGFAGASAGLALTACLHAPLPAVLALSLSSFCNDLAMPVAWATAAEVGGDWSATVAATMNMVGNVGGALYGLTAGLVLQETHHNWDVVLYMGAAVYSLGVPIWLAIDPVSRIDR